MGELSETLVQGFMLGGVYSLIALGVVFIYKSSRVMNLAQGELMMILAYILWSYYVSLGLPLVLSILLLLITSALMGLVIFRVVLRPLIGQSLLTMIIITLVLGFLIRGVVILAWGGDPKSYKTATTPEFIPGGAYHLGDIVILEAYVWSFGIALLIFLAFVVFFRYTKLGLGMRAVADDQQVSQSLGIGVKKVFALSWAISCIVADVGGALLGSMQLVEPNLRIAGLSKALPVVLLGGLESIPGALIGGLIIGIAELLGSTYIDPHVGGGFKDITAYILMLLILLLRPHGLFGLKTIERI